jgi:uncharacterized protein
MSADGAQPVSHLLYLHGFRSSPQSTKARQFSDWVHAHRPDIHWWCPQLPPSPRDAIALLAQGTADWPLARTAVIGSSLGGFYATVLAERWAHAGRVVVLNPAVHPDRDLADRIGETTAWHSDERFFFRPEYIADLRDMRPSAITQPHLCFAVIAKGDEVLDWRDMAARYAGCPMQVLEGNDHALSDFEASFTAVRDFLGLENRCA